MSVWIKDMLEHLAGKTIARVEAPGVNTMTLHFTDGTSTEISVEYFGHGIYGLKADGVEFTQKEKKA